jgi:hypothetical protein
LSTACRQTGDEFAIMGGTGAYQGAAGTLRLKSGRTADAVTLLFSPYARRDSRIAAYGDDKPTIGDYLHEFANAARKLADEADAAAKYNAEGDVQWACNAVALTHYPLGHAETSERICCACSASRA